MKVHKATIITRKIRRSYNTSKCLNDREYSAVAEYTFQRMNHQDYGKQEVTKHDIKNHDHYYILSQHLLN